jgi:hypothetical protein
MTIFDALDDGVSLHISANRTPKNVMMAGHAFRLFASANPPALDGYFQGEGGIYQLDFSGHRREGFSKERELHDAVRSTMRKLEKTMDEMVPQLPNLGEGGWKAFKELYWRYEILKVKLQEIPSDNPSRWYTMEDYDDPDVFRRRETADVVLVTSMSDAEMNRIVKKKREQ